MTERPTLPSEDDIALALGRIAMESARLEYILGGLEVALLGGGERTNIVVHGQGWATTKQGCEAVIRQLRNETIDNPKADQSRVELFDALLDAIKRGGDLMGKRGNTIHAIWGGPDELGSRFAVAFKRWGKFAGDEWPLAKLEELRADLRDVRHELGMSIRRVEKLNL